MPCYRRNLATPLSDNHDRAARAHRSRFLPPFVRPGWLVPGGLRQEHGSIHRSRKSALLHPDNMATPRSTIAMRSRRAPTSGEAYYRLGLALLKQNQMGEAYQAFNHAVPAQSHEHAAPKCNLAISSLAIYARDPRHPAALYKQAQSMADAAAGAGRQSGGRAAHQRRPGADRQSAGQRCGSAAGSGEHLAPNNAEVAGGLAQALLRDNQPDEAEKTARQTVEQHPQIQPGLRSACTRFMARNKTGKRRRRC